ncbi:MAG: hypothetical protein A2X18_00230 [Bacteroidetes bacterium GWF2_40_14]|nr:MAG: hypothetical protein A2X18_00230 [Bacteroidetes bacterium GWF2_40_14]
MQIEIREVITSSEIKKFIRFPHKLYKENKQYVPVLDSDEFSVLTKSPSLEYCKIRMWLAWSKDNKIVGRVAGIINPRADEFQHYQRIRFGWFDFIDDIEVAKALLDKVTEWGREEGKTEIHGPLGYNTWNRQGMLIEGFENTPSVNCLYNFSYYPEIMEELGYNKQVDWIQLKIPTKVDVPERIKRISESLMDRHCLNIMDIKKLKNIDVLVEKFFKTFNQSFQNIVNFIPLTPKEINAIGKSYFPMLRPELTIIVQDEHDNIAGFGICFPNLSESFKKAKGRLFPFGWYHIMRGFRKYDSIDLMMIGAAPEWQNKGITAVYHTAISERLKNLDVKYAISNPQAEDNSAYKVWERYEHYPYMKRRCYIKDII